MAVADLIDIADLYEWLLQLTDQVDALIEQGREQRDQVSPGVLDGLLATRQRLAEKEEQLQELMDLQAIEDAHADMREHGTIPWSEVKARIARP